MREANVAEGSAT